MIPAIPIYLATSRDQVFGLFNQSPTSSPSGPPVLICAPWGWDEVASYRSRKRWAERLAAAGYSTLRFDLPSTGNSGGSSGDPGRLESWLLALASSAEWLCQSGGVPRVGALGIGLGGLLAREAISRGAPIEELVLWGSPATGRAFVRETKAFSRLQRWSSDAAGLEEGSIEAGGFVLSGETIAALQALAPDDKAPSALRRALLLDRDGVKADDEIRAGMAAAGVDVTVGSGNGWGRMMSHPERSRLAPDVVGEVEAWLDAGKAVRSNASAEDGARLGDPTAELEKAGADLGGGVREAPWAVDLAFGRAFGILTEPVGTQVPGHCAVFLNAGAVQKIGPNRMWVEASRRWAAQGMRCLRVDLEGIGEADGDETRFSDIGEFYIPGFEDQVGEVLDSLEEQGVATRFLLVGLCAGGYWSFRMALRDSRVRTALLLNSGALKWHSDLVDDREARKVAQVWGWRWRWWKQLFQGKVSLARLRRLGRSILRSARQLARHPGQLFTGGGPGKGLFDSDFDRLQELDTHLTMAFSAEEPLEAELRFDGVSDRLENWPNVDLRRLPGSDHTLRSIPAQIAAKDLLDGALEKELEDLGDPGGAQLGTRQR